MSVDGAVVLLAGGTGGAKLARGLADRVADELVVVANVGDDEEVHGGHVSPDPDLVTFWLADRIDARGWGLEGDTFDVMDGLRELGDDVWFNLGDRDLALCLRRARRLGEGARLTDVLAEHARALGVRSRVLPPTDDPVRTRVRSGATWWAFQEFMIRGLGTDPELPVDEVSFSGADGAAPTPEVLDAISGARLVVVGPSNPVASIEPILAVPGVREAVAATTAPVVAVSPVVGGAVLKGPTAAFMASQGRTADADGVAATYAGLADVLLTDEAPTTVPEGLRVDVAPTLMDTPVRRGEVAARVLAWAATDREAAGS